MRIFFWQRCWQTFLQTSKFRGSFDSHVHLVKSCRANAIFSDIRTLSSISSAKVNISLFTSKPKVEGQFIFRDSHAILSSRQDNLIRDRFASLGISSSIDPPINRIYTEQWNRFLPRQLILNRLIAGNETLLDPSPRLNDNRIPPRRADRSFESLLTQRILNLSVYRQSIEHLDWILHPRMEQAVFNANIECSLYTDEIKKERKRK